MEVQLLILSLFNKFCIVFSQPLYAHKFVTRLLISDFSFVLNILFYNVSCSASYMLFDLFVYPLSLRFLLKKNWLKKLDNTYLWHQNKKRYKKAHTAPTYPDSLFQTGIGTQLSLKNICICMYTFYFLSSYPFFKNTNGSI